MEVKNTHTGLCNFNVYGFLKISTSTSSGKQPTDCFTLRLLTIFEGKIELNNLFLQEQYNHIKLKRNI